MSTTRRDHLVQYLVKELGSADNVKEFSSNLRDLNILDLRNDDHLAAVTTNGMIDTLVVLYKFGTLSKVLEVKLTIEGLTNG